MAIMNESELKDFLKGDKCEEDRKRISFFVDNPDIKSMYEEILSFNENSTEASRKNLFDSIKRYALANSPYYKKISNNDYLPIMSKIDMIENFEAICVPEYKNKRVHSSSTSGSTGIPLSVIQDLEKRRRTIADLKVYGLYALYPSHAKMLQLRAYKGKFLDRNVDAQNNIYRYDISQLNECTMPSMIEFINQWKPSTIFGYCSTMDAISSFIINNNIQLSYQCTSILVGGEMLSDDVAQRMFQAFKCPIFDRYSNMEMGIYAQREYGVSDFKFNSASYYLEIVKLDCDEPCKEGEIGRIVITDLYNKAFPMLRYDTGDLGSYVKHKGQIYLNNVLGRRIDTIFNTRGIAIDPHVISVQMWGVTNIKQWQFVQKSYNLYLIKILSSGVVDEDCIKTKFRNLLGNDATIEFVYVQSIPVTNSQKVRYIINEM